MMFSLWSTVLVAAMLVAPVTSLCHMTDDICEFWLEIDHHVTMVDRSIFPRKAVYPHNGKLYHYDVTDPSSAAPVDPDDVIVADGWEDQRLVVAANGSMPGPPIEVYADQTVIVHVTNKMEASALTLHWHGQHQVGTPWMDGVPYVTQCPILPHQRFTYRFKAAPSGTFWYHSHIGTQLGMGLLGAFIIRERTPLAMEEHVVMLQEWNHDQDADLHHARMEYGKYANRVKVDNDISPEGALFAPFTFHAGLINGRGRHYYGNGSHNGTPLTKFSVTQGQSYRFRAIGSHSVYSFRLSVDGHALTLVASDGYEIDPVTVESVLINPGERYDVVLQATQAVGSYWVRAETLSVGGGIQRADAILKYTGSTDVEPTTSRKTCTSSDRCAVVNCQFSSVSLGANTDCLSLGDLRSKNAGAVPGADNANPEVINELFLNWAFPDRAFSGSSVNGRAFKSPSVSALTQPKEVGMACDPSLCGEEKVCQCPYTLTLETDQVYQMVLTSMGRGTGFAHPIHMHGHSFHVLKVGYPPYDAITGRLTRDHDNTDVDCHGSYCNAARWADPTWGGNSVPGLELTRPVVKDTVVVPVGGYVVIRFRASNPGLWFMHCHTESHAHFGMALMMNESFSLHPPAPRGFPRCGDFVLPAEGVTCPTTPTSRLMPDPLDCTGFYSCTGGMATKHQCPSGLKFNPLFQVCDWSYNVDCTGGGQHPMESLISKAQAAKSQRENVAYKVQAAKNAAKNGVIGAVLSRRFS